VFLDPLFICEGDEDDYDDYDDDSQTSSRQDGNYFEINLMAFFMQYTTSCMLSFSSVATIIQL
jgi:hypothetical protein